jgi:eukaryotic-like serine/threonine-protein kinase
MAARPMAGPLPDSNPGIAGAVLSRRWRLIGKLGEGGMGEVHAAEPLEGGSRVAVKVLRREFTADADVRARFLDEGRTCMRLHHANIVRVIECAQADDGTPYLVMELLEGVPLGAYMQHGARVPLAQAAPILQGILSGLAAAHAHGIVHRDLKPDNVFLTRGPNGTFVVKVLDFGIAKVMDVAGGMGTRTRTGMLLGTPAYMSPEQARSARDVDQRADLWSAGVLFYEMLSGRVAFPAPTEYARLAALLSSEPEPIEKTDASLAPLAPFLKRALKKERDERFPTAVDMARALAAVAPNAALRSDPPGGEVVAAVALSRLPEVHSVLAPLTSFPNASRVAKHPAPGPASPEPVVTKGAFGTLASPAAAPVAEPPAHIVVVPPGPLGGTLPSKDRKSRARARRGVRPLLVALLVACALSAGFLLGWAVGRAS